MKVVLSIAGSDSSGGAGIQADLKTFEAFGVFGCSVLTVLTAQNTSGVSEIQSLPPSFVRAQMKAVMEDFEIAAIKIGMLYSAEIIDVVKEMLRECEVPVVLDPVFVSKAGSSLLQEDTVDKMTELFKFATLITPNQYEAKALFEYKGDAKATEALTSLQRPVLIKNHHETDNGENRSVDYLFNAGGIEPFYTEYIHTNNLHGTGCSFSSAIAANLALGKSLHDSISSAKNFISQALKQAPNIGHGPGPVNHKKGGEALV